MTHNKFHDSNTLTARRLGIDTKQEAVVYMREDCHICRSEGFSAMTRVRLSAPRGELLATLNVVKGDLLTHTEAGLSEVAWTRLQLHEGDPVEIAHAPPVDSFSFVRGKLYGKHMDDAQLKSVVSDIAGGLYTDVQISAFVAAASGQAFDEDETVGLTRAMLNVGEKLSWDQNIVVDKHCVGGLPGNRTTPLIVAIVAANGLTMPKTSSRAITSPAGTADMMETLAPVDLSLDEMRRVVNEQGGCVVWGGSVRLSPADDVLIRVERALDIDSEAQLVASVLSKKAAAGSTHVVLDIPVGSTAKVRTTHEADRLSKRFRYVAERVGLQIDCVLSDGTQPVGRGIGPALEAHDVLAVLENVPHAPEDLRERALMLAARVLELGGASPVGEGRALADKTLVSGRALQKFKAICEAQGGLREPPVAPHRKEVEVRREGRVKNIDNRLLARIAKLAGAPAAPAAGIELLVRVGDTVSKSQPAFVLHAETQGELAYALQYLDDDHHPIDIEKEVSRE